MTKENLHWHGSLTVENIEEVADMLRRLLSGNLYVFVKVNEYGGFRPDVIMNQRLNSEVVEPIKVSYDKEGKRFASVTVNMSYGVLSCSTGIEDEEQPWLDFGGDKVTITHRAPAGQRLYWVLAVQASESPGA